jgi:Caspase domain
VRLPDRDRSRVVLIGSSAYHDAGHLPPLPAVGTSVRDLAAALTDPEYGIVPPEHCSVIIDARSPAEIRIPLLAASRRAEDLLLVYFAGHGLVGSRRGELFLAVYHSDWEAPEWESVPYDLLRDTVLDSPASTKAIILDCCFSGRALAGAMSDADAGVIGQLDVEGSCVIASSPRNKTSLVLPGERYTAFTGRLLKLLRDGAADAPALLTMSEIYRRLLITMRSQGLPEPQRRGTGTADALALGRNRALYKPPWKPARRWGELLDEPNQLLSGQEPISPSLYSASSKLADLLKLQPGAKPAEPSPLPGAQPAGQDPSAALDARLPDWLKPPLLDLRKPKYTFDETDWLSTAGRPSRTEPVSRKRKPRANSDAIRASHQAEREELKQMVRDEGMDGTYRCPRCQVGVKGRNLIRHFDQCILLG